MTTSPINPTKTKATRVGDLMASIANTFGYTPTESVVVIGVTHDNVLSAHVRIDLEAVVNMTQEAGAEIGGMLNLEHPNCLVVALTDAAPTPGAYSERLADRGAAFRDALEVRGVMVQNAWHVGNGYSRPLFDSDPERAPYPGEPLDFTSSTAKTLQPAKEVTPSAIVDSYQADHTAPTMPKGSAITGLQLWEEIAADTIEMSNLTDLEIGHLVTALADHPKAIIATVAADLLEGISALGSDDDREMPRTAQAIGEAPEWNRVERLSAGLKALAPYATPHTSSNIHAIMSWAYYAKGRGTIAQAFASQAQRHNPSNHLAQTLNQLVTAGIVSPWAVLPWTAYRGQNTTI